jgi:hypothetical protein
MPRPRAVRRIHHRRQYMHNADMVQWLLLAAEQIELDDPPNLDNPGLAKALREIADFHKRHGDSLDECRHGKLDDHCGICHNDA